MDLLLFIKTVLTSDRNQCLRIRKPETQNNIQIRGESGEIVLPLILSITIGSFLFGSLFWLNKHYEKKTQEHLSDFRKDWNRLEKKYKD